jgi:S-layer family protein
VRKLLVPLLLLSTVLAGAATGIVQDQCGPFTDVAPTICPYVLEMYYLGITAGTSPTTYSPDNPVTRGQAAVFVSKGVNQSIARSSRRAALGQWWTTQQPTLLPPTPVGMGSFTCASDGADVWVPAGDGTVTRVRASDGAVIETWTGAAAAYGVTIAMGRVLVTGQVPGAGKLYMLDPSQPAGAVTTVADNLGTVQGLAFDGSQVWIASGNPTIAIVTPGPTVPWTTKTVGGFGGTSTLLFDGTNMWVTDYVQNALLRVDSSGSILQTVPTGLSPGFSVFDGANIWVPGLDGTVTVIRASTGAVLATLTGNGLDGAVAAAFDGERVLVANSGPETVSLFRAADLTPTGSMPTGTATVPTGVCSDGVGFWITLRASGRLARF